MHDPGISQVLKQNLITLPRSIAKSEGKVERKMQRNQLVWKARVCVFGRTLDSFLWAQLWPAPWKPWHRVMTPRQSLVWCSFSGRNLRDYTSWLSKWPKESLFITYIGVRKGMLWCLKYAWSVWIESRVQISGLRVRVGVQLDDDDRPQRVSVFFKFFGGILRV